MSASSSKEITELSNLEVNNILYITNLKIIIFYTRNQGYLSQFFKEFSIGLAERNHDVYNFSLKSNSYGENSEGISLIVRERGGYFNKYYEIFKIVKLIRPDVILANFGYSNPALLCSYFLRVKYRTVWFHTLRRQMDFNWYNIYIKSKFFKLSSAIITNSRELRAEVISDYYQPSEKVINIPFTTSAMNTKRTSINLVKLEGKIYIGCPGRVCLDKNQQILIELLSRLNDERIIIVYAGTNKHNLNKLENFDVYKKQIIHLGNLTKNQMVDFYEMMDLIVLPSFNEAFGLVLIESLSLGCNTLVSNKFGALNYIEEDISSITFDPSNIVDLIGKIDIALNRPKPNNYFKNLYIQNFSMNDIIDDFLSVLK